MHRYPLPARDGFEVVVGYDRPTNAYFAQVYDHQGENVLDRGDAVDRLLSADSTIDVVREFASLDDGLESDLRETLRTAA